MADSKHDIGWDVELQYGGKIVVWYVRAPNKQKALAVAALRLKHRPKGDSKVIGAKESQKQP